MGKIIYNKGFKDLIIKKTVAPTITFISKTSDSITVTFTNNSSQEATISYGLSSPPNDDTVLLAASATSNNIVISGLDPETTYTIFASANGTPENLVESEIVFITEKTDVKQTHPPQLWPDSLSANSVTFRFFNQSSSTVTINYGLTSPPSDDSIVVQTLWPSDFITISGLTPDTPYTIFANATADGLLESEIVSESFTTLEEAPAGGGGKNLLNPNLFTLNNDVLSNTTPIEVEAGNVYTLSLPEYYALDLVHVKVEGNSGAVYIDEDINTYYQCMLDDYYTACTFMVAPSETGLLISFSGGYIASWYQYYEMYDFQLEKNQVRTSYEPW